MAQKRIRYGKDGKSTRAVVGPNGSYFSVVTTNSFAIVDSTTGGTLAEGPASSSAAAKIKAKKSLEFLGVTFDVETRKKTAPVA